MPEEEYYFTREGALRAENQLQKTVFGKVKEQEQKELSYKYYNRVLIEETPEYTNWDGLTVIKKSMVELDYDGELETFIILGCNESDVMNNILSYYSPLAKVILGKKVGDIINFNGSEITIKDVRKIDSMVQGDKTEYIFACAKDQSELLQEELEPQDRGNQRIIKRNS